MQFSPSFSVFFFIFNIFLLLISVHYLLRLCALDQVYIHSHFRCLVFVISLHTFACRLTHSYKLFFFLHTQAIIQHFSIDQKKKKNTIEKVSQFSVSVFLSIEFTDNKLQQFSMCLFFFFFFVKFEPNYSKKRIRDYSRKLPFEKNVFYTNG